MKLLDEHEREVARAALRSFGKSSANKISPSRWVADLGLACGDSEMTSQIWRYFFVFVGGGLGAMLRHAVNRVGEAILGPQFPAWTMFVNVTGSLVMGFIVGWFAHRGQQDGQMLRLFLTTGILGGYTTFSAFSSDVAMLWQRHDFIAAAFYVLGSVALSLVAVFAGLVAARAVTS